ncbi:MAG TPA: squalene--hopene cyclase [Candidatus Omnitrophota bacterium]|nr:squalene--hopene cyclase [Candidatus Omnitrophota bacterium]HPN65820.1 squalene--hopene cyclase [Candidatus Omnitrophota bacterium]
MSERLLNTIKRSREYLLGRQVEEGYFHSVFHMDLGLEADTLMILRFLGMRDDALEDKFITFMLERRLEDGGWSIYPGGPPELNSTIKCYIALKLKGFEDRNSVMARDRQIILNLGGIEKANSFTKFYLAMFGLGSWDAVPAIPPELVLLPDWFPVNIYDFSAWTRTIVVPLSIIWSFKPVRRMQEGFNVDELYKAGRRMTDCGIKPDRGISWKNFFLLFDGIMKISYKLYLRPFRRIAVKRAERWMTERLEKSDGLCAIYPAMVNSVMALSCLGYKNDHPLVKANIDEVMKLLVDHGHKMETQPCVSPVWDTALAVYALGISGFPKDDEAMRKAARWLLSKQVNDIGDWKKKAKHAQPGGWYFEFRNEFYPDIDDSAQVLLGLMQVDMGDEEGRKKQEFNRGLDWMLKMQSSDGGFSSYDKDNNKKFLNRVPFADHNAMLDPTCSDITGRACELLGRLKFDPRKAPLKKAIKFLKKDRIPDGTWYGRWGVNYLYGTFLACRGLSLAAAGSCKKELDEAAKWVRSVQNDDGGWGESPLTYDDPFRKGKGRSCASQTAWALLTLFASGDSESNAVERGIEYLVTHQDVTGNWEEEDFTGTGFPRVCYLRYELYPVVFPLIALSEYAAARGKLKV